MATLFSSRAAVTPAPDSEPSKTARKAGDASSMCSLSALFRLTLSVAALVFVSGFPSDTEAVGD